jgi:hypothetical protein
VQRKTTTHVSSTRTTIGFVRVVIKHEQLLSEHNYNGSQDMIDLHSVSPYPTTIAILKGECRLLQPLKGEDNQCLCLENEKKNYVVSSCLWKRFLANSIVAYQMMVPSFLVALPWCILVLSQNQNSIGSTKLLSLLSLLPFMHLIFTLRYLAYKNLFTNQLSPIAVLISFVAAELFIMFKMLGNSGSTFDWILWVALTSMAVLGLIFTILVMVYRKAQEHAHPVMKNNNWDDETDYVYVMMVPDME